MGVRSLFRRVPISIRWTIAYLPIAGFFNAHFYTVMSVKGRSMQPTLNPEPLISRDIVIFDRYSVRTQHDYKRGDVVALKSPVSNELLVKRIIALEGDIVQTLPPYPEAEVEIPQGHAWIEGDETFHTVDSNRWGPIPLGLVDSKLVFIIWPLNRFGPIITRGSVNPAPSSDPVWRERTDELDREAKWMSRVRPAASPQ